MIQTQKPYKPYKPYKPVTSLTLILVTVLYLKVKFVIPTLYALLIEM